jgi:hypothetical protein
VGARARPSYICEFTSEINLDPLISILNFQLPCLVWCEIGPDRMDFRFRDPTCTIRRAGGEPPLDSGFAIRYRRSRSARGSGECPMSVWCRVSFPMLKHLLPARRDSLGVSNAPSASARHARARVLSATVTRPRHWLRVSDLRSGDCPMSVWCRVSFPMLKHPLPARRDSLGVSNAPSASVLAAPAAKRALGDRYTTTASAEAVGSWIRRLSHVRMVPGELPDAQTPAPRPP